MPDHTSSFSDSVVPAMDIISEISSSSPSINDTDELPARRKRRAALRDSNFIQMDDFTPKKKQKTSNSSTNGKKKDVEEEFATSWICVECKEAECMIEPEGSELLICDGVCRRVFHYLCAGLLQIPPDDVPFICDDCTNHKHICALCSNYGYDNEDIYKCSKTNCGMFYHESCLSMRNIEVKLIRKSNDNGIDEVLQQDEDEVDDHNTLDEIASMKATTELNTKSYIERRFVCPAHTCWTCTQIDLKDEEAQCEPDDGNSKICTKQKKTKKRSTNRAFEAKKEKFLTVCSLVY